MELTSDGTNWFIDGSLTTDPVHGSRPYATATCVDLPAGTTAIPRHSATVGHGLIWTDSTFVWDTGTETCALTAIHGHLTVSNYTNGALFTLPSPLPGYWSWTVEDGKQANVTCMQ